MKGRSKCQSLCQCTDCGPMKPAFHRAVGHPALKKEKEKVVAIDQGVQGSKHLENGKRRCGFSAVGVGGTFSASQAPH